MEGPRRRETMEGGEEEEKGEKITSQRHKDKRLEKKETKGDSFYSYLGFGEEGYPSSPSCDEGVVGEL